MYHFLRKRFGHSGYGTILFSTMYALMGYVVTQQSNIMWLDGVILLPILMLQVYKLVTEGKWKVYPVWIMLAIVTDFYIAYMLILFSSSVLFGRRVLQSERVEMEDRAAESRNIDRDNDIRNRNFGRNFYSSVV